MTGDRDTLETLGTAYDEDTASEPIDAATLLAQSGVEALGESPDPGAVRSALAALRGLSVQVRDALARRELLELTVAALKSAGVRDPLAWARTALAIEAPAPENDSSQGQRIVLGDPEPWPDPVEGADLLAELVRTFARFVALPPGAATALALWTVHAHALDAAAVSPLLVLASPEKRCGKSTTLRVLGALVPRALPASSISPAALFRGVERFRPTLLLDEADTVFRDNEELRTIINASHDRAGAYVLRTAGEEHEPRVFSTWCAKAIALIGHLPGTLADRAVMLPMRRRRPDETVDRLRQDRVGALEPLRRQCWRWAQEAIAALRAANPDVPDVLSDRAADNWQPLLAIADLVGGTWPAQARKAACQLAEGTEEEEASPGVLLLADLQTLFWSRGVDRLPTADIVEHLVTLEGRPWPEWGRAQKPLTARGLARLLRPFEVWPSKFRLGDGTPWGYVRDDLAEAFSRYLPSAPAPTSREGAAIRNNGTSAEVRHVEEKRSGTSSAPVPDRRTADKAEIRPSSVVPDGEGGPGGEISPEDLFDLVDGPVGERGDAWEPDE